MEKMFVQLAAALMFLAVAAGAFGSHGLSSFFAANPVAEGTYDTAVRYHMIHGLALLAAAWASTRWPGPAAQIAGWLFVAGIVIFSGSLYALSLTGVRWLGAITPVGGLAFLGGWLSLLLAAARG